MHSLLSTANLPSSSCWWKSEQWNRSTNYPGLNLMIPVTRLNPLILTKSTTKSWAAMSSRRRPQNKRFGRVVNNLWKSSDPRMPGDAFLFHLYYHYAPQLTLSAGDFVCQASLRNEDYFLDCCWNSTNGEMGTDRYAIFLSLFNWALYCYLQIYLLGIHFQIQFVFLHYHTFWGLIIFILQ